MLLSHAVSFPTTDERASAESGFASREGGSPVLYYIMTYYTLPKVLSRQPGIQSAQTEHMAFILRHHVYSTRRRLQ